MSLVTAGVASASARAPASASSKSLGAGFRGAAHSASTPTLGVSASCGHCHIEGTLLIAPEAIHGSFGQWQPLAVKHQRDGTFSFAPVNLADGRVEGALILDADWRQPFVVAPWKSLPFAEVLGQGRLHVYPFTLTYTPLTPTGGGDRQRHSTLASRRTVTFAATSDALRAKWLASFQEKTKAPNFRKPAAVHSQARQLSVGSLPRLGAGGRHRASCLSSLGEPHAGIPKTLSSSSSVGRDGRGKSPQLRLVQGRSDIWDRQTPHSVVRDLYDSYAADPIGVAGSFPDAGASRSSGVWSDKRSRFLLRYLERQSKIEGLLKQHSQGSVACRGDPCPPRTRSASPPPLIPLEIAEATDVVGESEQDFRRIVSKGGSHPQDVQPLASQAAEFDRFPLAAWTPNVRMFNGGCDVTVDKWSGGMLFAPPNSHQFRLSMCLLDNPAEQPIFFGVAPIDCDLAKVNVFNGDGGGVFMGMGGMRSEDYITALGALGGPVFIHAFGRRTLAQLPTPLVGETIAVLYWEDEEGKPGQVRFSIKCEGRIDDDLHKSSITIPMDHYKVRPGDWRPCLLMCVPGTRVRIEELA
mmetsp:Transcript_4901/g.13670  ORF Transcript_4901/g.13670 Transcript_4901/m.13670 type:complete len:581 (-) Transcript_4901:59-1801(-)